MDINEMMQQITTNPQFAAQILQMMQQNGMIPPNQGNTRQQMNWNMPTNPMAAAWYNLMSSMNNQNNQPPAQNQQQPLDTPSQPVDNRISSVRVIGSPDEIRAEEIPMNGTISLFLQDDLSVIYGKRWTNNGVVDNLRFVLEKDDQKECDSSNDLSKMSMNTDAFFERISEMMDEKLSKFKTPKENASATKTDNTKKGMEENGN